MTLRDWTDPRDGRHWKVWFVSESVLAFESDRDFHALGADSTDGIENRSDEALQRLLDEARG